MDFKYSRYVLSEKEKRLERFLEIVPGALSWTIIIGIFVFSIVQPLAAAVFMIAFILYWLLRLVYMNIFLILSYMRLEIEKNTDWMERISAIDQLRSRAPDFCEPDKINSLKNKISAYLYCRQLRGLIRRDDLPPLSRDIHHLVIIPVIRETIDIVEPGVKAIKEGNYPCKRFLVIIALEESATDEVKQDMYRIKEKYKGVFLDFVVIIHPAGQPGEAKVKGANTTHAAKWAAGYLTKRNIPFENVLVSCFDADTVPNSRYFGCLTYYFMISPDRLKSSYQPIPVYHNNVWEAPAFARIIDIGTSFFQLIEATNPQKLVTFSSHSMTFKALMEVGCWPVDMISDDSAIFWKAFIHYDGNYQAVPIYTIVSMDIATGPSMKKTFLNIYKQKRRWAWGVENLPIVIRAFLKSRSIPFRKKISHTYKMLEGFISWATWSFLLSFGLWMPGLFASQAFSSSMIYYTAPRIKGTIYSLGSMGIFICMIISSLLLPKSRVRYGIFKKVRHVFEWFFIPVAVIVLSAVPALDAQTRLMLGKYMEFWVTEKYRKN
ncbi:MAG: glycosyltransferase family 2 protein [Candidatus Omnitrophica bacterium]|nr:glycosyltransferase family 2 protein [Candidatus Omnitrophota bacterium]